MSIAEVCLLGSVLNRQDYRSVLSSLIGKLEQESLLESELLLGLVCFLQSALPDYLIDNDLVRILKVLRKRLKETHMQLGDTNKPASEHIYLLSIVVSRVLDTMVGGNVKGLSRIEDHRPLLDILSVLKESPDVYLKHQASYALQALQYIGDDESPLNIALRVGGGLAMAGLGVASAFRLDIVSFFNGLGELGEAAVKVLDSTKILIESVKTARDGGEGVADSVLRGFRMGDKRAWYPALQGARMFIREGRLAEFERIVYEAPCRHEQDFQWGVCQLLGEIAMDPIWAVESRQQAVHFLEDLHRNVSGWIRDSSVRDSISGILLRISMSVEKTIQIHFDSVLQDLRQDNGEDGAEPYMLISRLPTPDSTLLSKVLKAPSLEYDLHRVMARRLEEHHQAVYIPPHAKANLKASDDEHFPLINNVMEFLKSDRQVFLILGNSGSGKSTFNRHLETLNFTPDDIQELKRDRQFIIICDSYDESRLSINLRTTNMLNRPDQWSAKLIISCRSTHARPSYRDLFQPQPLDRYGPSTPHLFQEAAIVPFSEGQVEDYVDQFVRNLEVNKQEDGQADRQPAWTAAEYMDKLARVPNLLSLVKNPFLLKLSLKSLPVAFKDNIDPSTITMTRPKLFGIFIGEWLEVNRQRLMAMEHSDAVKTKLNELIEGDFKQITIDFLQDLAKAIYKEQAGRTVVQYVHREDKDTWKAKFFGPDDETTLLRQSSPLTCVENLHSFIHRSLLEYFRSLQMTQLTPATNKRENEQAKQILRTSQTSNLQTNLFLERPTPNDQRKKGNLPLPSATTSPSQNILPFNILNTLDPEPLLASSEVLENTFETVHLRGANFNNALEAESNEGISSDDEFEDAQEFPASDSFERVTQSAPISKHVSPKSASWYHHIAFAAASAIINPGAFVVNSGVFTAGIIRHVSHCVGHAASGALTKVDDVWKRTAQVLTTCKAHVDSVAPIAKTAYVYYDDEVYDAVLTEKSTGVTYVAQLLFDSTTRAYYVYVRWGETDYRLDGPYKTVEEAKKALHDNYHEQFGVQWKERETAVSERFTYKGKTYEPLKTFEAFEELEEIAEETEVIAVVAPENEVMAEDQVIATETTTTTTTTQDEVVLEHVTKDVIVDKKVEVDVDVSVEVDVGVEKEINEIATDTGAAVVGGDVTIGDAVH
ncbi:hypothetical protein BGW39_011136, partial [Mortierella sp. 14UC]